VEDFEHHTFTNFVDYGVEAFGGDYDCRNSAPHVQVATLPLPDSMEEWLTNPNVQQHLRNAVGPVWPIPHDHGYKAYVNLLTTAYELLGLHPPCGHRRFGLP
jgi:hypothetical protein